MRWCWIILCLFISGCSFAPTYQRPEMAIPASYKEKIKWSRATPEKTVFEHKPWWCMYHDPILNNLEAQVSSANQNIKAAYARYLLARAELNVARADYFPTVLGVANSYRQQVSGNAANKPTVPLYSDNLLVVNMQYEVDLWGRVRNSVAAANSEATASAADLAAVTLNLHAELATDYFLLRGDDAAQQVLNATVIAYQKALDLTRRRYKGGLAPIADVDQAENQLETAKTAAADMYLKRTQLEHAIAILMGRLPATFTLKAIKYKPKLVTIAPYVPSLLLERRPDIANAELMVQAANSNIGVARAAFFPAFNLSAGIGFESSTLSNLVSSPSRIWSLGPTTATALLNNGSMPLLTQTLFDGGRISALSDEAYARYQETVATYREAVLTAYQEVENSLIALQQLDREHHSQSVATSAANRALSQAMYRYKEGLTTYLDVVFVQNIYLQAELSNINISARRQVESVQLIKALGGGWHGN
jgi:NodT family efflux transporter outer membrane factor (OMF) lipoprotein